MKKIIYLLLLPSCQLLAQGAASPPPQVLNTAGTTTVVGGNYYGFNIGEPIAKTGSTGSNYYTQGFLQPDYKIGTAFTAGIYYGSETCQGANDGYILANPYNNLGSVTYQLFPGGAPDSISAMYNLSPGTYTLSVQDDSTGSSLMQVITIAASSEICPITIHHAFSPNADGLNDTYIIDGIEKYADNHVYFFNRWGQLVWNAAKYDNVKVVWDGKDNNGVALTSGTYFYVIEIKGRKVQKGWVEITR